MLESSQDDDSRTLAWSTFRRKGHSECSYCTAGVMVSPTRSRYKSDLPDGARAGTTSRFPPFAYLVTLVCGAFTD